jgi:hypothetical protein
VPVNLHTSTIAVRVPACAGSPWARPSAIPDVCSSNIPHEGCPAHAARPDLYDRHRVVMARAVRAAGLRRVCGQRGRECVAHERLRRVHWCAAPGEDRPSGRQRQRNAGGRRGPQCRVDHAVVRAPARERRVARAPPRLVGEAANWVVRPRECSVAGATRARVAGLHARECCRQAGETGVQGGAHGQTHCIRLRRSTPCTTRA